MFYIYVTYMYMYNYYTCVWNYYVCMYNYYTLEGQSTLKFLPQCCRILEIFMFFTIIAHFYELQKKFLKCQII